MKRRELQRQLLDMSEGLVESVTDLALHAVFYDLEVIKHPNTNTVLFRAWGVADKNLAKINYATIKRAVQQLTSKGLVVKEGERIIVTDFGKARLEKVFPSFGKDLSRLNGEVYLVSYDIRETTRHGRDVLRWWLKKFRAVMLQKSLFLVVTDLPEGLEKLIVEQKIEGEILITKLGKESLIGGKPIDLFLRSVYNLDQLGQQYLEFIGRFSKIKRQNLTPMLLDFSFNRIFKDDPNIPAEFLPADWVGFRAQNLYKKLKDNILTMRS